jgi:hypothetical protein
MYQKKNGTGSRFDLRAFFDLAKERMAVDVDAYNVGARLGVWAHLLQKIGSRQCTPQIKAFTEIYVMYYTTLSREIQIGL